MKRITCIEDLRVLARRKVASVFFQYAEAGSYSEQTLHANRTDLERICLRQRVMVDVSTRDTSSMMLGEHVSLPIALAPVGLLGLLHGDGEILACRAAQTAGIPFTVSTPSICSIEDARLAAKTGATALVVSNHGGRQLDGAPSTISVLPKVADAVGADIEVLFDGGIRSGQDLLRALALGAKGCLIGRAYIYGLGAGGQSGVAKAIDILRHELEFSMMLTGVKNINEIGRHVIAEQTHPA